MDSRDFKKARKALGKTQKNLALMLCISTKAVQSYEQGWREIPPHVEREILLLLATKGKKKTRPCWEVTNCPVEFKAKCPVWEFKAGNLCWFISGTYCQGETHKSWEDKIKVCQKCEVYQSMLGKEAA